MVSGAAVSFHIVSVDDDAVEMQRHLALVRADTAALPWSRYAVIDYESWFPGRHVLETTARGLAYKALSLRLCAHYRGGPCDEDTAMDDFEAAGRFFLLETLRAAKAARPVGESPPIKWGYYFFPHRFGSDRFPGAANPPPGWDPDWIEQYHDSLAELRGEVDAFFPSIYLHYIPGPGGEPGGDDPENVRLNLTEARRVRETFAPSTPIVPFQNIVMYHPNARAPAGGSWTECAPAAARAAFLGRQGINDAMFEQFVALGYVDGLPAVDGLLLYDEGLCPDDAAVFGSCLGARLDGDILLSGCDPGGAGGPWR